MSNRLDPVLTGSPSNVVVQGRGAATLMLWSVSAVILWEIVGQASPMSAIEFGSL